MAGMKVDLHGMFANLIEALRRGRKKEAEYYSSCLGEFETHLRETVAGKHTLAELADCYRIEPATSQAAE